MAGDGKSMVTTQHIDAAIELLSMGTSLVATARVLNLKTTTLYDALQRSPKDADRYDRALEMQAEVEVDEIKELADDVSLDPRSVRNMLDARKWRASKRKPRKYGDRLEIAVSHVVPIADALHEARARVRPVCDQANVVDAEIVSKSISYKQRAADYESAEPEEAPDPLNIFS